MIVDKNNFISKKKKKYIPSEMIKQSEKNCHCEKKRHNETLHFFLLLKFCIICEYKLYHVDPYIGP